METKMRLTDIDRAAFTSATMSPSIERMIGVTMQVREHNQGHRPRLPVVVNTTPERSVGPDFAEAIADLLMDGPKTYTQIHRSLGANQDKTIRQLSHMMTEGRVERVMVKSTRRRAVKGYGLTVPNRIV